MKESIDIYYHIDAVKFSLVRRIEVTAANVHDSQVDLAEEGEKQKIACREVLRFHQVCLQGRACRCYRDSKG